MILPEKSVCSNFEFAKLLLNILEFEKSAFVKSTFSNSMWDILGKIQEKLPRFPIVLHGASTIDKDEVDRINNAGGNLKNNAKGVSVSEIKDAIKLGVCKINIATDLRLLWTRIFREFFRDSSGEWDHLKPGKKYMDELELLLEKKFKLLLCTDKNNLFLIKK